MIADDLKPVDKVKLTGTGTEAIVLAITGNAVQVRTVRGANISTSRYQVELIERAEKPPKKRAKAKARSRKRRE